MERVAGLDLHAKETVFCVQEKTTGRVLDKGSFPTTRAGFECWVALKKFNRGTRIGLESGVQAFWVSRLLRELDMTPVTLKASEVRAKARRRGQKTDLRDAFEICDGLRLGTFVSSVYVPEAGIQRLRDLLSRRRHFVRILTRQSNAGRFILRARGLSNQGERLISLAAWNRLQKRTEKEPFRDLLEGHDALWRLATEQVVRLEKLLKEAAEPYQATLDLLRSVPGVGNIIAMTFLAAIADPRRFPDGRHLASYLGLVPSQYDSGQTERGGRITKEGPTECRSMLIEAAHLALRKSPFSRIYTRFLIRRGCQKAVVALASRLARVLQAIWISGEPFDADLWEKNRKKPATRKTKAERVLN
jgi:transposase